MREQGRCAGCAETGPVKEVDWHVTWCPDWARLYRENPDAALAPVAEYARWRAQDKPGEHAADLARRVADTQDRRARSVSRFRVEDPLGD